MQPRRVAVLLLGLLAVAAALVWAALELDHPPSLEDLEQLTGTEWFSVRVLGKPTGYACVQTELVEGPEGPRLRVTEDVKLLINLAGRELAASKSQVTRYDEMLRLVEVELVKDEMGRRLQRTARLADHELAVTTVSAATEKTATLTVSDEFASDIIIGLKAARGELRVGTKFEFEAYEPELDILDEQTVHVTGEKELEDGTRVLVIKAFSKSLGIETISWVDEQGRLVRQTVPGLMELTLERVSEEEALAQLSPLKIVSKIEVKGQLPSPRRLQEVRLKIARKVGDHPHDRTPARGRRGRGCAGDHRGRAARRRGCHASHPGRGAGGVPAADRYGAVRRPAPRREGARDHRRGDGRLAGRRQVGAVGP